MERQLRFPDAAEYAFTELEENLIWYYLETGSKREAAQRCNIDRPTAYMMFARKNVKTFIDTLYAETLLTEQENKRIISDSASANLADYYRPVPRVTYKRECVSLKVVIDMLEREIAFEDEVAFYSLMSDDEYKLHESAQNARRRKLSRLEVEYRQNPAATRIVDKEPELTDEMELDVNAMIADKHRLRIKAVKYTQHGPQFELYNGLEANNMMARIHGSFEKDNSQQNKTVQLINVDPLSEVEETFTEDDNDDI